MNDTLIDISKKIEPAHAQVLRDVDRACRAHNVRFILLGADARDCIMELGYGLDTIRATTDSDFAVMVESWKQYDLLTGALIHDAGFSPTTASHRYMHPNRRLVDLIPFGAIEQADHTVTWPGRKSRTMSVAGIDDVMRAACAVRVSGDPELIIPVATLAGLVVLKLIAWDEMYPERDNDAKDIWLVIGEYGDCGNLDRLYDDKPEIFDSSDMDYPAGVARLLGRHMAVIMSPETHARIITIIERECAPAASYGLARFCCSGTDRDHRQSEGYRLLLALQKGVRDPGVR